MLKVVNFCLSEKDRNKLEEIRVFEDVHSKSEVLRRMIDRYHREVVHEQG